MLSPSSPPKPAPAACGACGSTVGCPGCRTHARLLTAGTVLLIIGWLQLIWLAVQHGAGR